jgi:hypothetical protein
MPNLSGSASPEDDASIAEGARYPAAEPHLLSQRVEDNAFHL